MKKVVLLQARLGSTRLPGKVLLDVGGRPLLAQVVRRLQRCRLVDAIVIATTDNPRDQAIVELARQLGVAYFCGSEPDVLSRFCGAAQANQAEIVVRITADCPLIDPEVCDLVVDTLLQQRHCCDYASNVLRRTYPRGLDVEAMFYDTLLRLNRLATSPEDREHVTSFLRRRPDLFLVQSLEDRENHADLRWTVDEKSDLVLIRRLYQALSLDEQPLGFREIAAYVRSHPELAIYNQSNQTWDPAQGLF